MIVPISIWIYYVDFSSLGRKEVISKVLHLNTELLIQILKYLLGLFQSSQITKNDCPVFPLR